MKSVPKKGIMLPCVTKSNKCTEQCGDFVKNEDPLISLKLIHCKTNKNIFEPDAFYFMGPA